MGAHPLAGRSVAWALVVAIAAAFAFAILIEPSRLLIVVAGGVAGALIRVVVLRRRAGRTDGVMRAPAPAPARRGRWAVSAALLVVAGVGGVAVLSTSGQHAGPAPTPVNPPTHIHRVPYQAQVRYVAGGAWSGAEWFTLRPREARAALGVPRGPILRPLAAAVAPGWRVESDTVAKTVVYRIRRAYPPSSFHVPGFTPLLVAATLPAPRLRSAGLRYALYPSPGSSVAVHAPADRVLGTTPTSTASPETGGNSVRTVKLDVTGGADPAGDGVTVDVASDAATWLPAGAVTGGAKGVVTWLVGALGITLGAAFLWLWKGLKWLIGKFGDDGAPAVPRVLRGQDDKTAALRSYLDGRKLSPDAAQETVDTVDHKAERWAARELEASSDPAARARYDAARARLAKAGELPPLDVIYAALREAGISDGDLRLLDRKLDEAIAKALATPAVKA